MPALLLFSWKNLRRWHHGKQRRTQPRKEETQEANAQAILGAQALFATHVPASAAVRTRETHHLSAFPRYSRRLAIR